MSDMVKDRTATVLKKRESQHLGWKEPQGRTKKKVESHEVKFEEVAIAPFQRITEVSVSVVSHSDEPHQRHDVSLLTVQMENTYQLGPARLFPTAVVNDILKDVLTNYLTEKHYEPEFCRQMTKMISEVIKARVKDLTIPRYKLIVTVHIGQLDNQSILIGSRCLWDSKNDTFSSYVFRNSSLFALASVYAIYFE